MSAPHWVPVISEGHVPEGGYVVVFPLGLGVLLARVGGELYAVANKCAHMGCPLEGGKLRDTIITCPCHDWRFDIRDGSFVTARELRLRTFPTRVQDGTVQVDVGGE